LPITLYNSLEFTSGTVVYHGPLYGLSAPHSIFPDSIFDLVVSIPTDRKGRQISSGGDTATINVGGVIALPEGFRAVGAADSVLDIDRGSDHVNDIVFGPQTGQLACTVAISCQSERKDLPFSGALIDSGDRGRGQIYPDGSLSNNNSFRSQSTGVTVRQHFARGGSGTNIALAGSTGGSLIQHLPASSSLPAGPALTTGLAPSAITLDAPLTYNPNVGGFGQAESSIVVQSLAHTRSAALEASISGSQIWALKKGTV